jgi:hypothetical protein
MSCPGAAPVLGDFELHRFPSPKILEERLLQAGLMKEDP